MYRLIGKRVLDLALSAGALLLLWPVLLLFAALVRVKLGSPVIFTQERPGKGGRPFTILKFRTMTDARGPDGGLLPEEERLTAFGGWLRRASVDELPELLNVLRGEMSLVGPRPLRMDYLPLYDAEQARRHDALPGISGWAQVNGRNAISWEKKFELDVWYVDHMSLLLDLRILALTVARVLRRDGVSAEGHASMPDFRGSGRGE